METLTEQAKADLYARIANEEELIDRLNLLASNINKSIKIVWNYWRAKKAKDYIEWENIKKDIDTALLTTEGRLRLQARHASIGKRIVPEFTKMVIQLWPLAALWVIKKLSATVITKTVQGKMESRRSAKKLKSLKKKLQAGSNKIQPFSSLRKTI